ncbi:MAG: M20/M25/M40 family metallo-hydrolase [Ruminococcaceae bacterium]|nr:M20/M25/M40 family metallo-hydrolase [Oscillospiraceae bacterium]
MIYLYILLSVLFLFITVILVRTLLFKVPIENKPEYEPISVNGEKAIADLGEMIKCKTVSHKNISDDDESEFSKFKTLLPSLFPNIYKSCEYTEVGKRGLLYRYRGASSDNPSVLMAHFDVVSVEESEWSKDPFGAEIENGYLWGRGTLDTKASLNAAMQALEAFIASGKIPKNDIYLAFSGNEEVNGDGAPSIVDIFEKKSIIPAVVLDEGGAIVNNVFPGVTKPAALIGIAEKGMLNVELSYTGNGGHSSSPKRKTPIGSLSRACLSIENHPFKFRFTDASYPMFTTLAKHSSFLYRMFFANLWCFSPIINIICKKNGGEMNALLRTTCAFTQMEGSRGMNVIPAKAKMIANLRILPGETMDSALLHLKKNVRDSEISIRKIDGMNPSVISELNSDGYEKIKAAINMVWSDAIVSPYLMFACSDSRHWGRICNRVYRFSPMQLSNEERASIHGNNEKIPTNTIIKTVEFYTRFIETL